MVSLPSKDRQKVAWVLKLLEDIRMVPKEYWKKLKPSEIWECRVKLGSKAYRIFGFFEGNNIVLTHGILKKTQKTPKGEIKKAKACMQEHIRRHRRKR